MITKTNFTQFLFLPALLALSTQLSAQMSKIPETPQTSQTSLTADQIMDKVDYTVRRAFETQIASTKITTCKYTLVNGAVKCSGEPRVVISENAQKGHEKNGVTTDRQTSMVVRKPVSDKGTGLLIYEYSARGRDNDNWLYLPALGKVNRVIAKDDEGGSVFGSEFSVESTENPEGRKVDEFTYKILEDTQYQGNDVWVIEMTPKPEKASRTKYSRIVSWIDKKTFVALKEDMYRGDILHKQRTQGDIRLIDGIYVSMKVAMNNRTSSRVSKMDKMAMRYNVEVPDEYLSQRVLTDFAFRDRNLERFRVLFKN